MTKKCQILIISTLICMISAITWANSAPQITNVSASQRPDDSKLVDITYNLVDADGDACTVWVAASNDGGITWAIPVLSISGNVGTGVMPGTNKQIIWDAGQDMPGKTGNFKARVLADDGKSPAPMAMVGAGAFAYQNDYANMFHCDAFMIDKYEVTVSLYCQFLNAVDSTGTHWYSGQEITRHGVSGSYTYTPNSGRENYPVRYVSYNDANAYAAWKRSRTGLSYRLPTEQEWEKAAGWNPILHDHFTYAFQRDTIDRYWCNYSNYYGGPLPVGSFNGTGDKQDAKSYYGCYDMSGNVWEWTSGGFSTSRVIRGGYWSNLATHVTVTYRDYSNAPSNRYYNIGFRLVLDLN